MRTAIFNAVVASTTPELSVSDVVIEYYATAESGSVGDLGKAWMPLEGGKDTLTYPAISTGEQKSASAMRVPIPFTAPLQKPLLPLQIVRKLTLSSMMNLIRQS